MSIDLVSIALRSVSCECIDWRCQSSPASGTLSLRRAWPKSSQHMIMEFRTADDRVLAGQWFQVASHADDAADTMLRTCPGCPIGTVPLCDGVLVLHGNGADDKMPVLATWAGRPCAELIVHRPTKRAVVKTRFQDDLCYAKIVPHKRFAELADASGRVTQIGGLASGAFDVARITHEECTRSGGVIVWESLKGVPLSSLLGTAEIEAAAAATGRALRALHTIPAMTISQWNLPNYGVQEAVEELQRWVERTSAFDPMVSENVQQRTSELKSLFDSCKAPAAALIHRDFHDKQVFFDGTRIGLLDFDTVSIGDPCVDIGNFLAHIALRRRQGRVSHEAAERARNAFIGAYELPATLVSRVNAFSKLTELRLECVYAFRTCSIH